MSKENKLEILCSKDYERFSSHKLQRGIKPQRLAKIEASMAQRGFIPQNPVIVNKSGEILDGQHRFKAAENLGIAFYYVVGDQITVEDIREMAKTASVWDIEDHVVSQIKQENDHYWRLMTLKEKSGLAWSAFLTGILGVNDGGSRDDLRSGNWEFAPRKEAEAEEFLKKFELFRGKFGGWSTKYFVSACRFIFNHADYDHKQMIEKMDYLQSKLHKCATTADYIALLEDMYNYRSHTRNIVDFLRSFRGKSK